jgi:hypothetical protein
VVLVGQSAAYSPKGTWFAFTARPADGSQGPDIYVWKVGDAAAQAVTNDHRSTFGSWTADDLLVGSTTADTTVGASNGQVDALSFLLDPASGRRVAIPQTGRTWRPSVDPSGHRAVYWAGTLRRETDAPVYVPSDGQLVLGDWNVDDGQPSASAVATPLTGDQAKERHETAISSSSVVDWDARWDATGTKLAIWVASDGGQLGRLSLYDVDAFDGRIDLKKPLLDAVPAAAGFSISDGKIVWAEPGTDGSGAGGRVLVFAWTDHGAGTVETLSDQVVVIR